MGSSTISDHIQNEPFNVPLPQLYHTYPPLPVWIARRLLREGEKITWVRGPRLNPEWERFVVHPGLFVVALALAAFGVAVTRVSVRSWSEVPPAVYLGGGGLVLGSIFVLAIAATYFTRLVVTTRRVVILQGYEVCRSWRMDDLPPSLIRYGRRGSDGENRTVDLDALQTMLGGSSGQFTEAKGIMAFGKQLEQIKARKKDRS